MFNTITIRTEVSSPPVKRVKNGDGANTMRAEWRVCNGRRLCHSTAYSNLQIKWDALLYGHLAAKHGAKHGTKLCALA